MLMTASLNRAILVRKLNSCWLRPFSTSLSWSVHSRYYDVLSFLDRPGHVLTRYWTAANFQYFTASFLYAEGFFSSTSHGEVLRHLLAMTYYYSPSPAPAVGQAFAREPLARHAALPCCEVQAAGAATGLLLSKLEIRRGEKRGLWYATMGVREWNRSI